MTTKPPFSPGLTLVCEKARVFVEGLNHPYSCTSHLFICMLESVDDPEVKSALDALEKANPQATVVKLTNEFRLRLGGKERGKKHEAFMGPWLEKALIRAQDMAAFAEQPFTRIHDVLLAIVYEGEEDPVGATLTGDYGIRYEALSDAMFGSVETE